MEHAGALTITKKRRTTAAALLEEPSDKLAQIVAQMNWQPTPRKKTTAHASSSELGGNQYLHRVLQVHVNSRFNGHSDAGIYNTAIVQFRVMQFAVRVHISAVGINIRAVTK